jgi:ATP-dependent RNA helicase DeaD
MVRVVLNAGKAQGVRPNDVVRSIASFANIPGATIGSIHIQYQQTLVDVPERFLSKVLKRSGHYRIREHLLTIKQSR